MKFSASVSGNISFPGGPWFFFSLVAVLVTVLILNGHDASPLVQVVVEIVKKI